MVERELNIIGLRVDEGLRRLEPLLNHAFLSGIRDVRVIHGIGKGLLCNVVRGYLKGHEPVEYYGPDEISHGGDGVTKIRIVSNV